MNNLERTLGIGGIATGIILAFVGEIKNSEEIINYGSKFTSANLYYTAFCYLKPGLKNLLFGDKGEN
ncbi:MAG: hypothetical protein Q8O84_02235 [Nanoarchaeota archaeon]|nr:hypothetical protein [Nanoarchaeota archaeon]